MKKRVSAFIAITCAAMLAVFAVSILYFTQSRFVFTEKENQAATLRALANSLDVPQDMQAFCKTIAQSLRRDSRVTICDLYGNVLGDSALPLATLANHLHRPEIQDALHAGFGQYERISDSSDLPMLYSAQLWHDSYVLRIALPLPRLRDFLFDLLPAYIAISLFLLIIVSILSRWIGKRAIRPYSNLQQAIEQAIASNSRLTLKDRDEETRATAEQFNLVMDHLNEYVDYMRSESEKIETILSGMHDGVFLLNNKWNIVHLNKPALRFLGLRELPEDKRLLHLCRDKQLSEALHQAASETREISIEMQRQKKTYRLAINPAKDGMLILLSDISDIIRLERARRDFTANVSHELKTPLTTISGFSELVSSGLVTDPQEINIYMVAINTEAERMTRLVEDILKLSSIENAMQPKRASVNMRTVFLSSAKLLSAACEERGISISVEGDCDAQISPEHAQELADNLLSNAVRYNRENGSVLVALFAEKDGCRFRVSDTGIGIPEKDLPHIFERFYRVDKDRSRTTGGTGLGLAIVKHSMELYGGSISVKSDQNGTVLEGYIPDAL